MHSRDPHSCSRGLHLHSHDPHSRSRGLHSDSHGLPARSRDLPECCYGPPCCYHATARPSAKAPNAAARSRGMTHGIGRPRAIGHSCGVGRPRVIDRHSSVRVRSGAMAHSSERTRSCAGQTPARALPDTPIKLSTSSASFHSSKFDSSPPPRLQIFPPPTAHENARRSTICNQTPTDSIYHKPQARQFRARN
jgi:hypothetical protein